jgi:hypothetical protein
MLRVLAPQSDDHVLQGLMSALVTLGHDAIWLKKDKPAFDAFYEFQPNLVICYAKEFVEKLEPAIKHHKAARCIILKANVNEEQVKGYSPFPAANLAQLIGSKNDAYKCDISFINFATSVEAASRFIEPYLYPNYKTGYVKIFGNPLPYPNYIGKIQFGQIGKILANSREHLTVHNEFVYEAWLNGAVCRPFRPNTVFYPPELFDGNDREKICKWILHENTYYDRCRELLELAEFNKESAECYITSIEKKKLVKLEF